jgi:hypothetical protein
MPWDNARSKPSSGIHRLQGAGVGGAECSQLGHVTGMDEIHTTWKVQQYRELVESLTSAGISNSRTWSHVFPAAK